MEDDDRPELIAEARERAADIAHSEHGAQAPVRIKVERRHCDHCDQVHRLAIAAVGLGHPRLAEYCICTRDLQICQGTVVPED